MDSKKKKRFPWDEMRDKYVTGDDTVTLQSIADEYDTTTVTINKRSSKEGWVAQREEFRAEASAMARAVAMQKASYIRAQFVEAGMVMLGKSLNGLAKLDPDKMTPKELRCFAKDAWNFVRQAAGIADEINVNITYEEMEKMTDEELEKLARGEKI